MCRTLPKLADVKIHDVKPVIRERRNKDTLKHSNMCAIIRWHGVVQERDKKDNKQHSAFINSGYRQCDSACSAEPDGSTEIECIHNDDVAAAFCLLRNGRVGENMRKLVILFIWLDGIRRGCAMRTAKGMYLRRLRCNGVMW